MKTAVIQCPDTGPLESVVVMLRAAGYRCLVAGQDILDAMRAIGCDVAVPGGVEVLVKSWGYDQPFHDRPGMMGVASLRDLTSCDLFADNKAHKNYATLVRRWPRLVGRVVYYRINGCAPEHVVKPDGTDCGDEIHLPCPILTPNLHYTENGPWAGKAYSCWPPFVREAEYYPRHGRVSGGYAPPICLLHGAEGWGYAALFPPMRQMGVRIYGVRSPDGLVPHGQIPATLGRALAMVHLKSSDAPGYAILECLAAACPLVCTRRLIWRSKMESLLIPNETCLVFDRETHDPLSPEDVRDCTREVADHLERLRDPAENARIGLAGRERLLDQMWDAEEDGPGFKAWMERQFPQ